MQFDEFTQVSLEFWNEHLRAVAAAQDAGRFSRDGVFLYPSILLSTDASDFFIVELIGARPRFDGLEVKTHNETSINRYFYQFDDGGVDPAVLFQSKMNDFIGLQFSHPRDEQLLHERFPFLPMSGERPVFIAGKEKTGAGIAFGDKSDLIAFQDCIVVNTYLSAIRVKHIHLATVIRQEHSQADYKRYLDTFRLRPALDVYGLLVSQPGTEAKYYLAAELANVFLFQGLHETTLGKFLEQHPEILETALCSPRVVYEPFLEWIEGAGPEDTAINPDLLVQRADGHFDIYDLKRPLLDKAKLTKGDRTRRRFVDYVEEGAAQLAHYAEYFSHPANRDHAKDKYQVTVDEPKLGLVVGTSENLNKEHVSEACRKLKNFEIIDYDTILHLFLKSGCSAG